MNLSRKQRDTALGSLSGAAFVAFVILETTGIWSNDRQLKAFGWVLLIVSAAALVAALVIGEDRE